MTCREYEPLIALYVEGDLNDRDVERHLAECSDCRELLGDLRVSQAALKELATVDAAFLSAVRSGVLARIADKRRIVWPWIAAFAAAVVLIAAILTAPRKPALIAKAPVTGGGTGLLAGRPSVIAQAAPKPKRSRPARRPRTAPPEPLVVKMLTDDPNIVIIWLVDQRGD
jgi:hypothetical protein